MICLIFSKPKITERLDLIESSNISLAKISAITRLINMIKIIGGRIFFSFRKRLKIISFKVKSLL